MNKIRRSIIALKIEWHWLFVTRGRKRGNQMVDKLLAAGKQLNAPKLMSLNNRLSRHTNRVTALTAEDKKSSDDKRAINV